MDYSSSSYSDNIAASRGSSSRYEEGSSPIRNFRAARANVSQLDQRSTMTDNQINPIKDEVMSNVTREEIDAKLGQNKAEMEALASEMRREMAEFRTFQTQQFSAIQTSISDVKTQISGLNGEVTGLKGHVDGLKTSSSTLQWMVGVVLAVLAIILAIPQVQSYFKIDAKEPVILVQPQHAESKASQQQEPIKTPSENQNRN